MHWSLTNNTKWCIMEEKVEYPIKVHIRRLPSDVNLSDVVLADRSTRFGNPEPMKGKSEKERNRVCDYYDAWFHESEQGISGYRDAVLRTFIDAKYIGCWCAPKRCHVDTIIEFIKAVKGCNG